MDEKKIPRNVRLIHKVDEQLVRFRTEEGLLYSDTVSVGTWWYMQQNYAERQRIRGFYLAWLSGEAEIVTLNQPAGEIEDGDDVVDEASDASGEGRPPRKSRKRPRMRGA